MIDIVFLIHAHIDHAGYLPKLVKEGFFRTNLWDNSSLELIKILLLDAGKLQEEEARYAQKKVYSKHEKSAPLFTIQNAERVFYFLTAHACQTELLKWCEEFISRPKRTIFVHGKKRPPKYWHNS